MDTTQAIRRTLAVLPLAALAVACSAPLAAPKAPPTPVMQTIPEGKFTAEFPGAPKFEIKNIVVSGSELPVNMYSVDTAHDAVMVGYVDYPKGSVITLDGAAEGTASGVNGVVQTRTKTTFMGHPAMDVVIKAPNVVMYERLIARDRRLYTVMGVAATGKAAAYDRLLETFVLI